MAIQEGPTVICDFCGKTQHVVRKVIVGMESVAICNECVDLCNLILREDMRLMWANDIFLPAPPAQDGGQ